MWQAALTSIGHAPIYSSVTLGEVYLREREPDGAPTRIVLNLNSTDGPTHGEQEGSAYHGYFRQHMDHPLLVFDGETGQVITAILRPGTAHAGHGALAILRRLRQRWPHVIIELRADAGFAKPEIYAYCERERIAYTIGLMPNARLERLATPLRTEALAKGTNTRFVVTTRPDPPETLYAWYTDRGETENWVKDLKAACFADRLSCHRFLANQVRLLLHGAAYCLLDTLRRWLVQAGSERLQLATVRLRLLEIGGRVRQLATQIHLRLASHHPGEPLRLRLASREGRS